MALHFLLKVFILWIFFDQAFSSSCSVAQEKRWENMFFATAFHVSIVVHY